MVLFKLLPLEGQGHIPAPAVGAHHTHAALQQPHSGLIAHARARNQVLRLAPAVIGVGAQEDNIAGLEGVVDLLEVLLHILGGDLVSIGLVVEVHHHAVAHKPVQRHLVNGPGPLTAVHGGVIVVGGIHMGSGMGAHLQELDSPAVALRQILNGAALKEASHLLRGVLVVAILNLGNLDRGITGQSVFNGNRQVNDFHSGYTPFDSAGGRCLRLIR